MDSIEQRRKDLEGMVGKKVSCYSCGDRVNGEVVKFHEDETTFALTIEHDPVMWGKDKFNSAFVSERKEDGFGGLKHVILLDEQ